MDIFQLSTILRRWWFVTIPILAISVFASFALTSNIQPEYTARGSILFNGPRVREDTRSPGDFEVVNPLLEQPSALVTAAVITSLSINTPDVAAILASEGLSSDYEVGPQTNTPILIVIARGDSRDEAIQTALRITELVDRDVRLRQEASDIPENALVTTAVIGLSAEGGADYGARNRFRIVLLALGIAVTVGTSFLLEGQRRFRRREDDSEAESAPNGESSDSTGHSVAEPARS